jgi:ribonuclease Z
MVPRQPPRRTPIGFLYVPPYRLQGISVAGEESVVQIPELDLCFDIGLCPRPALSANYVALSHGHMDHAAALSYYFSQRHFQGMGEGTVLCHPKLEQPIHHLMRAWVEIENQRTPYHVVPLEAEAEFEVKHNITLRGVEMRHTVPAMGYVAIERRSKLKPELAEVPQEELVQRKKQGQQITETHEIPLLAYTGDTAWGPHFEREDVLNSRILITECTFLEEAHRDRAEVGKHLHLDDIVALLERSNAEAIVLTHLSRRTHMNVVRQTLDEKIPARHRDRVLLLMDNKTNRKRYEQQVAAAEANA